MKKSLLILPLAAALALSSCSKDETLDEGAVADGNGRFLAVSIVPTNNGGGTRADATPGAQYGDLYEDGTTTENAVKAVRLYFFNASGDAVSVKKGSTENYYDIEKTDIDAAGTSGSVHEETVEQTINAIVIVEPGEKLPAQIVAVVNPNKYFLSDKGANLAELNKFADDYAYRINKYNTDEKSKMSTFTMANSVYADGKLVVNMTTVTPDKYAKKAEDAKKNPVKIYVERNVAKVRVSTTENLTKNAIGGTTQSADAKGITKDLLLPVMKMVDGKEEPYVIYNSSTDEKGTQVYVKFYGWDVTATLKYGYLLKHIDPNTWSDSELGGPLWNAPQYHRSYWADECNAGRNGDANEYQYFSYANVQHFESTKFDGKEQVYCNENAERPTSAPATKIIIKAELCDANGNPLTITEFAGNRHIDVMDKDGTIFPGLKNRYLVMYKGNRGKVFWKAIKNTDNTTTYKEIEVSDLDFMTATAANGLDEDKKGTYYVYPCLKVDENGNSPYVWYSEIPTETNTEGKVATVADVNAELKKLTRAKIWNTGMTYYYADIKHLGTSVGVVRNHIYDVALDKIYGLGTPVYDPDEVIIPEKPQNEETYVAAQINILSWRVVNSKVELNWND